MVHPARHLDPHHVSQGISDAYLRWRGIEATLQLAQSPNSKAVIVGDGGNGLPIILNTDAATVPAAGQRAPSASSPSASTATTPLQEPPTPSGPNARAPRP